MRKLAAIGGALATVTLSAVFAVPAPGSAARTINVPADVPTLAEAVLQADAGDTIVLDAGTYPGGVTIPSSKTGLTIRGTDRNAVILDGRDKQKNGIVVHADGVSILNLTAHDFLENAFYWEDVTGFRASYLTAWNIRGYGVYSEGSSGGLIDHDYVSGAADAAFYIGECRPCRSTITNVVARRSAVGYSGTNASASLVIRDSLFDENGIGIIPNTYANEKDPPQASMTIVGNTVRRSGRARVPIHTALAGFIGIGIAIAGGNTNDVRGNEVVDSESYGIAVFPTARRITFANNADTRPYWLPQGNRIVGNRVTGSGRADIALAAGVRAGNCFARNTARSALPSRLGARPCTSSSGGDPSVAAALTAPVNRMIVQVMSQRRPPDFRKGPPPPPQPSLP